MRTEGQGHWLGKDAQFWGQSVYLFGVLDQNVPRQCEAQKRWSILPCPCFLMYWADIARKAWEEEQRRYGLLGLSKKKKKKCCFKALLLVGFLFYLMRECGSLALRGQGHLRGPRTYRSLIWLRLPYPNPLLLLIQGQILRKISCWSMGSWNNCRIWPKLDNEQKLVFQNNQTL